MGCPGKAGVGPGNAHFTALPISRDGRTESSKGDRQDVPDCHPQPSLVFVATAQGCPSSLSGSKEWMCHTAESFLAVGPRVAITTCKRAGMSKQ